MGAGMKLALVSFACLLMHGGDISGLIAVTPASAAPAATCGKRTCPCTQNDPFGSSAQGQEHTFLLAPA